MVELPCGINLRVISIEFSVVAMSRVFVNTSEVRLLQPLYISMYICGLKLYPKPRSVKGVLTRIYAVLQIVMSGLTSLKLIAFCIYLENKSFTDTLFIISVMQSIMFFSIFCASILFCIVNFIGLIDDIQSEAEELVKRLSRTERSRLRKCVRICSASFWLGMLLYSSVVSYYVWGDTYFSEQFYYPFAVSNYVSAVFIYAFYQVALLVALASIIYQIIMVYFVCVLFDNHKASLQQLIKRNCLSTQSLDQSRMEFNTLRDLVGKLDSVLAYWVGLMASGGLLVFMMLCNVILVLKVDTFTQTEFTVSVSTYVFFIVINALYLCLPAVLGIMLNNKVIL